MWFIGGELSDGVAGLFLLDAFGRALGLMLIGVGLFRLGFVQGNASQAVYRRAAVWGFGVGVPLSAAGLLMNTSTDWAGSSALSGHAISTFGTVPMALGHLSLIVLWAGRNSGGLHARFQAVGRMALTNYLTQTLIGLAVLTTALDGVDVSRTFVLGFVVAVWGCSWRGHRGGLPGSASGRLSGRGVAPPIGHFSRYAGDISRSVCGCCG